jgi:nitric oxide dioxygenase
MPSSEHPSALAEGKRCPEMGKDQRHCPVTGKTGGCPFAEILKATAPAVAPKVPEIVNDFYPRMFKNDPETKKFFNPANQFANPALQRIALGNAVVAYASNIEQPENLAEAIKIIAHKHCGLSVQDKHYPIVHRNLMAAIAHVLGDDVVTPEVGEGWSEAVLSLANVLIDAEKGLYQQAAERRGGWSGVKDFKVSYMEQVTSDCVEFTFTPVDGKGPIDFTPGQFLTLHLRLDGATPRHYSITSAPGQEYLKCCVKKIPGGFVSGAMHNLNVGDIVGLAPPFGAFQMTTGPAVLISAGIGATPMQCFLKSAPESVRFILHVDKNEKAHPFKANMEAAGVPTLFHYTEEPYVLKPYLAKGRPSPDALVQDVLKPYLSDCDFYLCGPASFLNDMKSALESAGAKRVHVDVFGPSLSLM